MKKLTAVLLMIWLVLPVSMTAKDLGVVSTADYMRFRVHALDSAGIPATPDSGHILVWFEGEATANSASYSNRWINAGGSSAYIDSVRYASHDYFYFIDQVADVDNDEGNGVYTGVVYLYTDGLPTPNDFTFTLAGDELADYWAEVTRQGDSIDAYDDWIAQEGSLTGLDSAAVYGAVEQLIADSGVVRGDSSQVVTFQQLRIVDGVDGGNVFYVSNTSSTGEANAVEFYVSNSNGRAFKVYNNGAGEGATILGGTGALVVVASVTDHVKVGSSGGGEIDGVIIPADTLLDGELIAIMPDDWDAADSTAYQGSAAGLDSTSVARAVWNAPGANHPTAGTFGSYLDTAISDLIAGSGAYSTSIVTYDSSNSQVVAGAAVTVRNLDQSALLARVSSNSVGSAVVNLDAGSYVVSATAPGYIFAAFDTVTISGTQTDTALGYQFDPGSPASPSLCRVYGFLYTMAGGAEVAATVSAYLPGGVSRYGGSIVSPFPVTAVSDDSGYFYLDLIPSPSLTGSPDYEITINRSDGTILRKRLTVPDSTSWQITW